MTVDASGQPLLVDAEAESAELIVAERNVESSRLANGAMAKVLELVHAGFRNNCSILKHSIIVSLSNET